MTIVEKARRFVEEECRKPSSLLPYDFYLDHLIPVQKDAKKLCRKLGGDTEVISIAAWLHDIGSIVVSRKEHHITSAKITKDFLKKNNYDKQKTKMVLDCILHHRQSTDFTHKSIEEKIISDADAISNFDNLPGHFYATMVVEKLSPIEAAKSVKKKLENKWKKLYFKESKDLIRAKFKAVMLLLKEITKIDIK